jgi:tight adherence protein B
MNFNLAGMDAPTLLVLAGVLLSVLFVFFGLKTNPARSGKHLRRRLNRIRGGPAGGGEAQAVSVKRSTLDSSMPSLDRAVKALIPHPEVLRERLRRTGSKLTIGEYVLVNFLTTMFAAYFVNKMFGLPLAVSGLAGITVGLGLPHKIIGFMIARRLSRFTTLFPEAIDLIVRGLKSGLPVTESIKVVGEEIGDPVGIEFRGIADAMKLGQSMEDSMWDTAKRLDTPDFKFFVISLSVQRETGGNLTETLDNLSDILRKRRQMKNKVKAMSSEAKASGIIIGSLPFIMFAIIYILNPGYVSQLFVDPRGQAMLAAGALSMLTGIAVMAKMIKFEI